MYFTQNSLFKIKLNVTLSWTIFQIFEKVNIFNWRNIDFSGHSPVDIVIYARIFYTIVHCSLPDTYLFTGLFQIFLRVPRLFKIFVLQFLLRTTISDLVYHKIIGKILFKNIEIINYQRLSQNIKFLNFF